MPSNLLLIHAHVIRLLCMFFFLWSGKTLRVSYQYCLFFYAYHPVGSSQSALSLMLKLWNKYEKKKNRQIRAGHIGSLLMLIFFSRTVGLDNIKWAIWNRMLLFSLFSQLDFGNPGQKVSGQKVSNHKVSKSDTMCHKVSSQKSFRQKFLIINVIKYGSWTK